jgi:uncharacterized protein (TIRG00374 family)
MNIPLVLLAFAFTIPSLFIKTLKWKQLVNPFKVRLSMKDGITAWLVGFFIGLVTPGRVGDLARAFYLKEKMEIGKALTTVVVDRILDIFVLMVLAGTGIIFVVTNFAIKSEILGAILVVFFLFALAVVVFLEEKRAIRLLRPVYNIFVPEKYKHTLKTGFADFYAGVNLLKGNKIAVAKAGLLSVIAWTITFTQYFILAMAMGIGVNYFLILMIMPTIVLVEILPISFSGIGTRDAALILFFSFIGLNANSAVSLSLSILMFNYIYSSVGLAVWIKKPIKL